MKTPILLFSALSFNVLAALPTPVNGQITDAVDQTIVNGQVTDSTTQPTEVNGAVIDAANNKQLDTVNVTADFRQLDVMQIPSSITVVGEEDIQNRNANHLESVLSLAPNVNFAAGSSRARFYQIRGIGERSQFIDPVSPSVGLFIDGIDMTGLGGAATLFDIDQVEILRGPQGTAFGANALAGAINITSKQPTKDTEGYVQGKIGNYNTLGLGAAISGSLSSNIQARFAINQFKTDGYMENIHLNREDTNNIDELIARAQLAWQVNTNNDINISLFSTDINNGYDAFSLDNNRNTYSDEPGEDSQNTNALSIKWFSKLNSSINLEVLTAFNDTKSTYAYDDDWAFGQYTWFSDDPVYTPDPCTNPGTCFNTIDGYSAYDEYNREYKNQHIDFRLLSGQDGLIFNESTEWVIGAYHMSREESLNRNYTYLATPYNNSIENISTAIYSELTTNFTPETRLTYGIRIEEWHFDFEDNNAIEKDQSETLWSGKLILESLLTPYQMGYMQLSRGVKAGGINRDTNIPEDNRTYETETNKSLEFGLKSSLLDESLQTRIAVFYIQREDQQVKQSYLYYEDSKPKFKDYFANAAEGENYGIEIETNWNLTSSLSWNTSIGYLKTKLNDYTFKTSDENDNIITINKDGREQAHAPEISASTALNINFTQTIRLHIETEYKDSYYFSNSHDQKSESYQLWHAALSYTNGNTSLSLNGHNLTDEEYAVKGFYFGNDPRDGYAAKTYTQLAAPRLISIQATQHF
ncbi:MAG: TonB-dependent receptor [Gammaproteobacteria bacterium]|nr:TonB-dependent receptor [Gammaproteobacteria bacterium]